MIVSARGVAAMMTDQLDSTRVFVACGPQLSETRSALTEQNFTVISARGVAAMMTD